MQVRVTLAGMSDVDAVLEQAERLGIVTSARADGITDAIANGSTSIAAVLFEWAPVVKSTVGAIVEISCLKSRPELNGELARVVGKDNASGRVAVRVLSSQQSLKLQPLNLLITTSGETAASQYYYKNSEGELAPLSSSTRDDQDLTIYCVHGAEHCELCGADHRGA